jgi:Protein of unknown function (DUF2794)
MADFGEDAGEPQSSGAAVLPLRRDLAADFSPQVSFNREELREILNLYGRKVAAGEWRDYAIDFTRERAVFSVFRRAAETPLYRIEKEPKLAARQGAFSVSNATGLIMKRGHELARVLRVLDKDRFQVLAG